MKLLKNINRAGTTIIMVTHDKAIVNDMKMRVVAIENGEIVRDEKNGVYGYDN
jgi:cell division transport system ATP-binding protein